MSEIEIPGDVLSRALVAESYKGSRGFARVIAEYFQGDERAAVVRWLRGEFESDWSPKQLSERIEAGEHRR